MFYYIYKITNIHTQKPYIGSHQTSNLDDGYFGSGIYLKRAIAKYGIDSFKKEILEFCSSKDEMHRRETEILLQLQCEDTYNLKFCALGGNTRIKYDKAKKAEYINKLIANPHSPIGKRGEKAFNYGKKASITTREKLKSSRKKFLETADPADLARWKNNVVKSAKPRCALMSEIRCMPIKVVCRTTGNVQYFKSKTECAKFFNVRINTLSRYITNGPINYTRSVKLLLPFIIEYAPKSSKNNK
jgi:group I intron endonuclease